MRHTLFLVSVLAVVVAAPACATKKLVRGQVGHVNAKVDSLAEALEVTRQRTTRNERRIGDVDRKVDGAARAASSARRTADAAGRAASEASRRAARFDAWSNRLVYDVTLSEDQGQFVFGASELPPEARARIDEVVGELVANPTGVYIEIEGHTDHVGPPDANRRLGLARAEAAKRYIHEHHSVPLHHISVISFGEDRPAAPNSSADGRARNRRIVIRVLS